MANAVTIHGGQPGDTISFAFTVTGTHTTFYANQFANNVNLLLGTTSVGGDSVSHVSAGGTGTVSGSMTPVYLLDAPTVGGGPSPSYTINTTGYVLDTISGGATINLTDTVGADTVLVAAINAQTTIVGNTGGENQITFVTGENEYIGTMGSGGDTLVGGSGQDTVYTSKTGSTTVNSGTGNLTAYLQDTTAGTAVNDFAWLDDGSNIIYAEGLNDAVIATVGDQNINGDTTPGAGAILRVELTNQPSSVGTNTAPLAADTVNALNTDTVAVFDYTSNNMINGGTGILYFVAGDSISATVHAGTGPAYLFGGAGDSITLGALGDTASGPGSVYFVSGGNETLSGAAETGTLYAFAGAGDSLSGGTGFNVLTAGAGSETLAGGSAATATNYFNIDAAASAGANLVLNDFSTDGRTDLVLGGGFTQADVATIEDANGSGGNLVVKLSDGAQLTFTGITSGSQLTGHIILNK